VIPLSCDGVLGLRSGQGESDARSFAFRKFKDFARLGWVGRPDEDEEEDEEDDDDADCVRGRREGLAGLTRGLTLVPSSPERDCCCCRFLRNVEGTTVLSLASDSDRCLNLGGLLKPTPGVKVYSASPFEALLR